MTSGDSDLLLEHPIPLLGGLIGVSIEAIGFEIDGDGTLVIMKLPLMGFSKVYSFAEFAAGSAALEHFGWFTFSPVARTSFAVCSWLVVEKRK